MKKVSNNILLQMEQKTQLGAHASPHSMQFLSEPIYGACCRIKGPDSLGRSPPCNSNNACFRIVETAKWWFFC